MHTLLEINPKFQKECIDRVEPAVLRDVDDMIRGRAVWRKISTATEVLGRVMAFVSTVLAYSASSELATGTVSRALAFSSGATGTIGIVSTLFANFSRSQSIERSNAMNTVLKSVRIKAVPDVMDDLDVQTMAD